MKQPTSPMPAPTINKSLRKPDWRKESISVFLKMFSFLVMGGFFLQPASTENTLTDDFEDTLSQYLKSDVCVKPHNFHP
jgi:hypothetical protein